MPNGIRIKLDNGKVYDSSSVPIVFYESFSITGGSSGSKQYPALAGFNIFVSIAKLASLANENTSYYSISYSSGYPVLSWFPSRTGGSATTQTLLVFVR